MIKFNMPLYDNDEIACVKEALCGLDYIKATEKNSGSSALDMAFACMDLPKGSEVIIPSFNYPSIANTILKYGLKPVFTDTAPSSTIMDIAQVMPCVSEKTRCIVPVHYGGLSIDLDKLIAFASERNIYVLEDAALSFGGEYKKEKLGTIGNMGIVSFHETKNISCGSGGVLIINDKELAVNASKIYNNGTDKEAFMQGKVDMYSWQCVGINAAIANNVAAILYAQFKKLDMIAKIRQDIYEYYYESLSTYKDKYEFILPEKNSSNKENYHVFCLSFSSLAVREKVRHHLKSKDIFAHTHYVPLHLSHMGKKLGYKKGDLPNTESIFEKHLRLPLHNCMSIKEAKQVVSSILEAL